MKSYNIPHSDIEVSSVVLGLMRISEMGAADVRKLYNAAISAGINFFDHADVYGGAMGISPPLMADYGSSAK